MATRDSGPDCFRCRSYDATASVPLAAVQTLKLLDRIFDSNTLLICVLRAETAKYTTESVNVTVVRGSAVQTHNRVLKGGYTGAAKSSRPMQPDTDQARLQLTCKSSTTMTVLLSPSVPAE